MPVPAPSLTVAEVTEIRLQYLTDPSMTVLELSKIWGLPTYRIASVLKGKDFELFKTQFQEGLALLARDKLLSASELAADYWIKAMPAASAKGDHRPMKDLLAANRVIDLTPSQQSPVVIQIGISADAVTVTLPVTPAPGLLASNPSPNPTATPPLSLPIVPIQPGTSE